MVEKPRTKEAKNPAITRGQYPKELPKERLVFSWNEAQAMSVGKS